MTVRIIVPFHTFCKAYFEKRYEKNTANKKPPDPFSIGRRSRAQLCKRRVFRIKKEAVTTRLLFLKKTCVLTRSIAGLEDLEDVFIRHGNVRAAKGILEVVLQQGLHILFHELLDEFQNLHYVEILAIVPQNVVLHDILHEAFPFVIMDEVEHLVVILDQI